MGGEGGMDHVGGVRYIYTRSDRKRENFTVNLGRLTQEV